MPGVKVWYHAWLLHTVPGRWWADHLSQPSSDCLSPLPSPLLRVLFVLCEWARAPVTWFPPSCYSTSPSKALPEFLTWPLTNFCCMKSPRTWVDNNVTQLVVKKQDSNFSNPTAESSTYPLHIPLTNRQTTNKKSREAWAQMVENLPAVRETWIWSLGWKDPWRRKWQPSPVFLPGESHWQRSLAGYSLWGHKELDTTQQLTHTIRKVRIQNWLQNIDF